MCRSYEENIIHYVSYNDVVPGLLSLENTSSVLRSKTLGKGDVSQNLVDLALKYQEKFATIITFLMNNLPSDLSDEEAEVFTRLCSDIIKGFKETEIGQKYEDDMFVPIGTYILLENGSTSVLDRKNLSQQVIELILKEPIKKIKTWDKVKDGHSMSSYMNILSHDLKKSPETSVLEQASFFKPEIQGKPYILWTKKEDGRWKCVLGLRGRFLKSLQLSSDQNDFSELPFLSTSKSVTVDDGDHEILFIFEETQDIKEDVKDQTIRLKLATPFGILRLAVEDIRKSMLGDELQNISVVESVATILHKSISRMLAVSAIASGEDVKQMKPTGDLITLIQPHIDQLEDTQKAIFKMLKSKDTENPLSFKKEISEITNGIIKNLTKTMTIHYADFENHKKKQAKKLQDVGQDQTGFWQKVGLIFSWLLGRGEQIEDDYVEQLEAVLEEMKMSGILKMDAEKTEIYAKIAEGEDEDKKTYLLERIFMSYLKDMDILDKIDDHCINLRSGIIQRLQDVNDDEKLKAFFSKKFENAKALLSYLDDLYISAMSVDGQNISKHKRLTEISFDDHEKSVHNLLMTDPVFTSIKIEVEGIKCGTRDNWVHIINFPKKSNKIFGHLTAESKKVVQAKITLFRNMHEIRELYGRQCYIGFTGPQNSGKSTLLNALFGKNAETGMRTHTEDPTKYHVANDIFAIDFPGSDSLADQICASLESSGHMNNLQIFVMMYNGSPNQQLIANVKQAYKLKKLSGKSSETLFCLNKASALASKDNSIFNNAYRKEYVDKIRDHILKHPYDEKEESLWKRLKEGTKEHFGTDAYKEIARMNAELKAYTLEQMKDEDFIFTDWEDEEAHKKGIKGPEDVRLRIRKYLVDSKIRTLDNTVDI